MAPLVGISSSTGLSLFLCSEEDAVGLSNSMPFMLETSLKERGGNL
jgi:hypothetical protein